MSDVELVQKRRRTAKRNASEYHETRQSKLQDATRKRHSSGGAMLQERRLFEFGPVWLNGDGSVSDLTPIGREISNSECTT